MDQSPIPEEIGHALDAVAGNNAISLGFRRGVVAYVTERLNVTDPEVDPAEAAETAARRAVEATHAIQAGEYDDRFDRVRGDVDKTDIDTTVVAVTALGRSIASKAQDEL